MTSSQVQVSETPPMSQQDLEGLKDENGLYAGKFKTVEDLANSYKELEGKLGSITEEAQPKETTEESTEESTAESTGIPEGYEDYYLEDGTVDYKSVNENYGETLGQIFKEGQVDPYKISAEFHKNKGEIPQEMYQSLLDAGLSKNSIDSYLTGRATEMGYQNTSSKEIAEKEVQSIRDSIGGDETYGKMVSWAMDNLPQPEIDGFNEATKTMSGPQLKLMVQGLYTQYQNAMGIEPNLVTGKPASSGPAPYRSSAEVKNAMNDPRYGKDVTYTQDVYARLEKSDVFGKGI